MPEIGDEGGQNVWVRFTKPFWAGIAAGSTTVAFRRWHRPTVVVGRPYRTGGGRVTVTAVEVIEPDDITTADAEAAGYKAIAEVLDVLPAPGPDKALYRVRFELLDEPDPREVLAADADLDHAAVADIDARLDRYDKASSFGPWTAATLGAIAENPGTRAPDLAESFGRETKPFKLDVRKLKNLGLTHSLRIGYELSPRGRAYLDLTSRA